MVLSGLKILYLMKISSKAIMKKNDEAYIIEVDVQCP